MPPGKAIVEGLWGRSGYLGRLFKGGSDKAPATAARQAVRHQATTTASASASTSASTASSTHALHSAATEAAASSLSGRSGLLEVIVNVAKTLTRAPGQSVTARHLHHQARPSLLLKNNGARRYIGSSVSHNGGARHPPSSGLGFGNLRPSLGPRRIMGNSPNLGLGTARNFSYSSRNVFDNVVQNAPLGLRVLGDDYRDKLDMSRFRREMRRAHLKARRQQDTSKGKGRLQMDSYSNGSRYIGGKASALETYFPAIAGDSTESEQASIQLVLPLNPVGASPSFLSTTSSSSGAHSDSCNNDNTNESASSSLDEDRIFSSLLMSDLRFLSDLYGNHQARIKNLLLKLEMAGCFDEGEETVRAVLDEVGQRIIVTFYNRARWSLQDVRQVLGIYGGGDRPTWYSLVDLLATPQAGESPLTGLSSLATSEIGEEELSVLDESDLDTLQASSSMIGNSIESFHNEITWDDSIYSILDEVGSSDDDYNTVSASLRLPTLDLSNHAHSVYDITPTSSTSPGEYIWGVEDFIDGLSTQPRPTF